MLSYGVEGDGISMDGEGGEEEVGMKRREEKREEKKGKKEKRWQKKVEDAPPCARDIC